MNTVITLQQIDEALQRLREFEAELEVKLADLESRRSTAYDFNHPAEVRQSLRQLREGAALAVEGVDAELFAVLNGPEIRRFRFAAPGIAPLLRLRERLLAEQRADQERTEKAQRIGKFKYIGRRWKHTIDGRSLEPGDVVELTELQAEQFPNRFERV